ncbi:MAG: ribose-phosphate diphosphokinase [Bacilli bacterium]|nr:ribose-phosphate diphosphokinase [Bacilli bacterium]
MNDLKLIVMQNIDEIGKEVDDYLKKMNRQEKSYMMDFNSFRFNNGEGKVTINETVRDKDVFILSDVGNYSITYEMHGFKVHMSPDEHFQDIKRCISALSGYARRITIITPLLYQSRQDKRKGKESLDCAIALQELERLNIDHIITFDCHERKVANAIPNLPFENFYPTNIILEELIQKEDIIDNLLVISPDMGAMERARYYADMLSSDVGMFYKRRDLTRIINGKNPIVEHAYMGADVKDKNVIVVDDLIASGSSMIEVGAKLREKGAKKIFFITTFSLFTEGINVFKDAYKKKYFDKLYTTNLTYIPKEFSKYKWMNVVNCSKRIAEIIDYIHEGKSLKKIVHGNDRIIELLNKKK